MLMHYPAGLANNHAVQQNEREVERRKNTQDEGDQQHSKDIDVLQIHLVREREEDTEVENSILTRDGSGEEETMVTPLRNDEGVQEIMVKREELKTAQQQDPDIGPIMEHLGKQHSTAKMVRDCITEFGYKGLLGPME